MTKLFYFFAFLAAGNVLAAEQKFLLVGDSHTLTGFGRALVAELPGTQRYAVSGSATGDWLKKSVCPAGETCRLPHGYVTPNGERPGPPPPEFVGLESLLNSHPGSPVILALGTNDARVLCRKITPSDLKPAAALAKLPKKRKCFWVGPPRYVKGSDTDPCQPHYDQFVGDLKKVVKKSRCQYIDSWEILDPTTGKAIEPNTPDVIHFDDRLSSVWAKAVAEKIKGH